MSERIHGGPGAGGPARWDFSSNANAVGPCPAAMAAVQAADPSRYPDPSYAHLREKLAAFHRVKPSRIVMAGSASEFIVRITSAVQGAVWVPAHAYGDYAAAAGAQGRLLAAVPSAASLAWLCEPSSPQGLPQEKPAALDAVTVLDRAYEPLRLSGAPTFLANDLDTVWQLWTPNKALGLTGIRSAYAIAPRHDRGLTEHLEALSPSWAVGSHGVALLSAWCEPAAQDWLAASLGTLREWKERQVALCQSLGWKVAESDTNYFCAVPDRDGLLPALAARGVQLRDTASFGLPGQVRLSVQPPEAQDALAAAWRFARGEAA